MTTTTMETDGQTRLKKPFFRIQEIMKHGNSFKKVRVNFFTNLIPFYMNVKIQRTKRRIFSLNLYEPDVSKQLATRIATPLLQSSPVRPSRSFLTLSSPFTHGYLPLQSQTAPTSLHTIPKARTQYAKGSSLSSLCAVTRGYGNSFRNVQSKKFKL